MKQIELIIKPEEIDALKKACDLLKVKLIEWSNGIATIEYYYNSELFRLGAIYATLKY